MMAYDLFLKMRKGTASDVDKESFDRLKGDLGYGLLLKQYTPNVVDATEEQIQKAAKNTVPGVAALFWLFRIMVAAGVGMLIVFALSFYFTAKRTVFQKRWLLRVAFFSLPLPWIAIESGWFVAESGRQPWAIGEVLPTFLGTSTLSEWDLIGSIAGFVFFYTILLVVEMYLMVKFARQGPSSLHTGRYHFEKNGGGHAGAVYADKLNDRV
jgi:cytochrome d ubiquinol oxidase subunit I